MKLFSKLVFILGFFVFLCPSLFASKIVLNNEQDSFLLGKYIRFLEDKNRSVSIEDVLSGKFNKSFVQGEEDVIYLSYGNANYWLEFPTIQNLSEKKEWFIVMDNYFNFDFKNLSVYFVVADQVVDTIEIPSVKDYQLQKKFPLIFIPIPPELLENKDLKIFVHSDIYGYVVFPFSITNTKISTGIYKKTLLLGIFSGAVVLLLIYNLFIFISFGDKAYLFYISYLFFWLLAGIISLYKLEVLLGFYIIAKIRIFFWIFVMLSLIGYIYYFLETKKRFPSSIYPLGFLAILLISTAIINSTNTLLATKMISIEGVLLVLLGLWIGIVCYIRGCRQARFFLVGWVFFTFSILIWVLYIRGVLPYSPFVAHINLLGSLFEATFLSLALADRFYLLKLEKDEIYEKLKKANQQMIQAFGMTVEKRDPYTAGHQFRISKLSESIAKEMKLDGQYIESVKLSALIHDIGKIGVSSDLLVKKGKLKKKEFQEIQKHVLMGHDIIKNLDIPQEIKDGILHHHERLDGSGYPKGIIDKKISLIGKILAVADTVEAITNARPYRKALGLDAALKVIQEEKGKTHNIEAVEACLKVFEKGFIFPKYLKL